MRTTHRSTANTKLLAKRTPTGRFKDVQTHKRASRRKRDLKDHCAYYAREDRK